MGKADKGTPKDIAKRMKAKGLQKLKFWCQMCQKQCRDANGFKCHLTSDSHLRQMKLFSENASSMMTGYSREFEQLFLETLRLRHTTNEVNANNVYQEVIQDKQHVHMNSTIWATLSDFVKYLGKTGRCHVRETERGWYIQYVEQDASKLAQQEAYQKRQVAEAEAEKVENERTERQRVEAAKAWDRAQAALEEKTKVSMSSSPTEQQDQAADNNKHCNSSTIKLTLLPNLSTKSLKKNPITESSNVFANSQDDEEDDDEEDDDNLQQPPHVPLPPNVSATVSRHSIMSSKKRLADEDSSSKQLKKKTNEEDKRSYPSHDNKDLSNSNKKGSYNQSTSLLLPNILVRIVDKKKLAPYVGRKAIVDEVYPKGNANGNDGTTTMMATVTVLDSGPDIQDGGQVLTQVSESQLETVVPNKEGKRVCILRGRYRGHFAKIVELNKKNYRAVLELEDDNGTIVDRVDYDDFSKAA